MEPRSIERGKVLATMNELEKVYASMEPRSIERGKDDSFFGTTRGIWLQWSRDQLNAESEGDRLFVSPIRGFNGAAIN